MTAPWTTGTRLNCFESCPRVCLTLLRPLLSTPRSDHRQSSGLSALPGLALFDALEDEEALSIGEHIIGHLSDPHFSVAFDQLICEELVLVSSSSSLVNPLTRRSSHKASIFLRSLFDFFH